MSKSRDKSIPETGSSTSPKLNLIPFNPRGKLSLTSWMRLFEKQAARQKIDEQELHFYIPEYLQHEAFDYFCENLVEETDWNKIKQKLLEYFPQEEDDYFTEFVNRRHQQDEDILTYYRDKTSLAEKAKLNMQQTITGLNAGINSEIRKYMIAAPPTTAVEWLQKATKLIKIQEEADHPPKTQKENHPATKPNRENYTGSQHFAKNQILSWLHTKKTTPSWIPPRDQPQYRNLEHRTPSWIPPRGQPQYRNLAHHMSTPPSPCRFCYQQGLPAQHWRRDCPQRYSAPTHRDVHMVSEANKSEPTSPS
ncbi:uncharacterized protein LOC111624521 isoform X2 [Centruroides sculpturatus]|uniref:uncharacterized protein LOC111624521 isoform X2 n=1 Tax=Centruroides sculpturatus TaxID=218467 RepID=UPI000C6EE160|nr:uncharacterized protein LOC111624521 isoform X2 [Centruroides sculpturatus]